MMTKREYVYQAYHDGKIYGDVLVKSPQEIGRINAQNRRDGAYGSWVPRDALTEKELANKATEGDLAAFQAKCAVYVHPISHFCGR